jgi:hypothetical protein
LSLIDPIFFFPSKLRGVGSSALGLCILGRSQGAREERVLTAGRIGAALLKSLAELGPTMPVAE